MLDGRLPRALRLSPLQLGALDLGPLLDRTPDRLCRGRYWRCRFLNGDGRAAQRRDRGGRRAHLRRRRRRCLLRRGRGWRLFRQCWRRSACGRHLGRRGEFCFLGRGGGFGLIGWRLGRGRQVGAGRFQLRRFRWRGLFRLQGGELFGLYWRRGVPDLFGRRFSRGGTLSGFLHHRRFDPEQRQRRWCSRFILLGKYLLGRCPSRRSAGDFLMRRAQQRRRAKPEDQHRRRQQDRGEQETKAREHGAGSRLPGSSSQGNAADHKRRPSRRAANQAEFEDIATSLTCLLQNAGPAMAVVPRRAFSRTVRHSCRRRDGRSQNDRIGPNSAELS